MEADEAAAEGEEDLMDTAPPLKADRQSVNAVSQASVRSTTQR